MSGLGQEPATSSSVEIHNTSRLSVQIFSTISVKLRIGLICKGMNDEKQTELERLRRVLDVAKKNGNQLFIQNIEREITALERGDSSPLIQEYLTEEERASTQH